MSPNTDSFLCYYHNGPHAEQFPVSWGIFKIPHFSPQSVSLRTYFVQFKKYD